MGRKTKRVEALPSNDEEELDLSDQDMEMLTSYDLRSLSFLTTLNASKLSSKHAEEKIARPTARGTVTIASSDDEAEYEQQPRSINQTEVVYRLPIKTKEGLVVPQQQFVKKAEASETVKETKKPIEEAKKPQVAPKGSTHVSLGQAQESLASAASLVLEDPEKHLSHLHDIRQFAASNDYRIVNLCLLTQLAVFKDILPGYRIRRMTDKENAMQVSREVKTLRQFEESLLSHYQLYLQALEGRLSLIKPDCSPQEVETGRVALVCLCQLIQTVPHFNFRLNIITAIVAAIRKCAKHDELLTIICEAIQVLFQKDKEGHASLEAIKLISHAAKKAESHFPSQVIDTFLSLSLSRSNQEKHSKRQFNTDRRKRKAEDTHQHLSKKARKLAKHMKEVEADIKEAEATIDEEDKKRLESETIKFVFLTYFRIIKLPDSGSNAHLMLLTAALKGLGRFAHVINIEMFHDLLAAIKTVCETQLDGLDASNYTQKVEVALSSVLTVFQIMESIHDSIKTDLAVFYATMYTLLSKIALHPFLVQLSISSPNKQSSSHSKLQMVIETLELMFRKTMEVPATRVAAYVKRFCTILMNFSGSGTIASLSSIHKTFLRFPRLLSLLESEEQLGDGLYKPYVQDADICNPFATSLWELPFLQMHHYHPTVRASAKMVLHHSDTSSSKATPSELQQLARTPSVVLLSSFDCFSSGRKAEASFRLHPPVRNLPTQNAKKLGATAIQTSEFMLQLQSRLNSN